MPSAKTLPDKLKFPTVVLSAAISTPSTVPDITKLPVKFIPVESIIAAWASVPELLVKNLMFELLELPEFCILELLSLNPLLKYKLAPVCPIDTLFCVSIVRRFFESVLFLIKNFHCNFVSDNLDYYLNQLIQLLVRHWLLLHPK